ncbi:hypothetical protein [Pseudovibrio ascidiaceicola]|uniref:hypothetical protein n=1 Tax=Pseudovibrio ascidiaceicola TaxID=285279 RepID=UPI001AD91B08|nr:hypothetical protein [Pseudovibrio ascidiaceicola]
MRADIRRLSFALVAQEFRFINKEISAQLGALPPGRAPNEADLGGSGIRKPLTFSHR